MIEITPLTLLAGVCACAGIAGLATAAMIGLRINRTKAYAAAREQVSRWRKRSPEIAAVWDKHARTAAVDIESYRPPTNPSPRFEDDDLYASVAEALFSGTAREARGGAFDRPIFKSPLLAVGYTPSADRLSVPPGIYWCISEQAFRSSMTGERMGDDFNNSWWHRLDDFPQR